MKPAKRLLSLFMALALIFGAQQTVVGTESPAGSQNPSPWAEFDIFMAQIAYGFGNEEIFSDYRSELTGDKFALVCGNLGIKFGVDSTYENQGGLITRGQVVKVLYEIIMGGKPAEAAAAAKYFIVEGLIKGRGTGGYQLDEVCTVEEMIVLSKRVYEHIIYKSGKDAKGFFWEIKGEGKKVYLFGSVPLSNTSVYPLNKLIGDAFLSSKNIVVESYISEMSSANLTYVIQKGFYKDGTIIKDHISKETYELYVKVCTAIGLPPDEFNFYEPWLAALILQQLTAVPDDADQAQTNSALGIDMQFLLKALSMQKNIIELESFEFQVDLLSSFPAESQEAQLKSILLAAGKTGDGGVTPEEQAKLIREKTQNLIDLVISGDEEALEEFLGSDADPLTREYNNKIFIKRNIAMAEKIIGFLTDSAESGDYFIVVSAEHMLGKDGLVKRLSDKGYTVERIR